MSTSTNNSGKTERELKAMQEAKEELAALTSGKKVLETRGTSRGKNSY